MIALHTDEISHHLLHNNHCFYNKKTWPWVRLYLRLSDAYAADLPPFQHLFWKIYRCALGFWLWAGQGCMHLPNHSVYDQATHGQFLSWVCQVQSQTHTKFKENSLPYHLVQACWRIAGLIPLPRLLMQYEMQITLSRIWTWVAMSISFDDNHYTMSAKPTLYGKMAVADAVDLFMIVILSKRSANCYITWY